MIQGIGLQDAQQSLAAAQSAQTLDKDAFTQLLVTQLRNQDPLSPQTNEELAAQLAQFSSLEQMELVNENLVGLARLQQGNALVEQLTGASLLVDKRVGYVDPETGQRVEGQVSSAKIEDGLVFLSIDGVDVPLVQVAEVLSDVDGGGETGDDETDDEN
ncbi:MAG: flagellar hook capping FlgD N-terminal domain-containing protein [Planctomycetota bacterium]